MNTIYSKSRNIRSFSLILILTLCISAVLSGCGKSSEPAPSGTASGSAVNNMSNQQLFVQSYLNLLCKQDFQGYANACGFNVSEVESAYPDLLDNVIDIFLTYELNDSATEKFREELKEIFNHCKYEVKEQTENEDGSCSVNVEVQKLAVFKDALSAANKDYDKWVKKQPKDADEEKLTEKFIDYVIAHCKEELESPKYKDPKTITIILTPSPENPDVYNYDSKDLGNLQAALVDFGAWDKDVEDEKVS